MKPGRPASKGNPEHREIPDSEECPVLKAIGENPDPRGRREKMESLEWRDEMEKLEWMVPWASQVETD